MQIKTVVKNGEALKNFFEGEKAHLLHHYPGLTLKRLQQDFKLMAFIHGIDNGSNQDEIFDRPYLAARSNPLTIFFEKLAEGVPLEYITGYRYFYKSIFKVSPDVLIPRSETEILIEKSVEFIKSQNKSLKVLDLGTGSGAIALSLIMENVPPLDVVASDISEKALTIALENFNSLKYSINPNHKINFVKSDRFLDLKEPFDLILSNPPYIKRHADESLVHHQVLNFEPHLALFLADEAYDTWFSDLFKGALKALNNHGTFFMEGHEDHLEELRNLALKVGFKKVEIIKDYNNHNRFLKLSK